MIKIRNVYKRFGGKNVLNGLNLDIYDSEIITIIGSSGQGKTVLFKLIVGLLKSDSGSIIVDGTDITRLDEKELLEIQSNFGMLFQSAALFDSLNVYDNVAFGLRHIGGMSEQEVRARVREVLKLVSLDGTENLSVSALSGGMKKRVGLARAIATSPKYLLYDEPTTGLDPVLAESINDLILKINREVQVTSIVVTHDMNSAFKISSRVAFLHNGVIEETAAPDEIVKTENAELRKFIASSTENLLGYLR
ncbi:MAG: ATP-binding cassette domain-containing protein [Elusimicrobia bacterium]|nr:ATP-binding cassette domain-containing protein [Elusimicrobiota bacterium]